MGVELRNKTLGVIGLGKIGSEVAKRAKAFDMKVIGYDPYISKTKAKLLDVEIMDLINLFIVSDFITIHLPKTEETKNMLNKEAFSLMKDSVRIINCARGGIINEEDLLEAIDKGKVAGAAIDVFSKEPNIESPLIQLPQEIGRASCRERV